MMSASSLFSLNQDRNTVVIRIDVEKLDIAAADRLKSDMIAAVENSEQSVIVDLGKVRFIDSSGLGALVSVRKRMDEDRDMRFQNMTPFVEKLLRLTKLDRVFVH